MDQLQLSARFKIQDGKLDEFKALETACQNIVKEKEKGQGTLQYDWFYNADGSECVVRETYSDSAALLTHMGNVGEPLGQLLGISVFSAELYGTPSEDLKKATEGLDVTIYSYSGGI